MPNNIDTRSSYEIFQNSIVKNDKSTKKIGKTFKGKWLWVKKKKKLEKEEEDKRCKGNILWGHL